MFWVYAQAQDYPLTMGNLMASYEKQHLKSNTYKQE